MTSGSSADTTWTFSGEMAAPAVGESTADDTVVQSVDSSTKENKAKPSSTRSRTSTNVKEKSMVVAGRRTSPLEKDGREVNSEEMVVETIPVIEDASPIGFHSPG